jgi:hypothetical protein
MLEALRERLGVSRRHLDRLIAMRIGEMVFATHALGYVGSNVRGMFDHHLQNFRIGLLTGDKLLGPRLRITLVGDFASFSRSTVLRDCRRAFDVSVLVEGLRGFKGLRHLLPGMSRDEIYKAFDDAQARCLRT